MSLICFFDIEAAPGSGKIIDIGATRSDGVDFHENNIRNFLQFAAKATFWCGHNVLAHDLPLLKKVTDPGPIEVIDTLLLSPLLFPQRPYHKLLKDDKLQTEELNNPVNDSKKAAELLDDEVNVFHTTTPELKEILYGLLHHQPGFASFFRYVRYNVPEETHSLSYRIKKFFANKICSAAELERFIEENPVGLAYTLALLNTGDRHSVTPPWVLKNYPVVEKLVLLLRGTRCLPGCAYCEQALDPVKALVRYFGFPAFRSYGGEALQEKAVRKAVNNGSLLAVFPTGGGKSLTFQVPALMAGENTRALTVVISPLQSLMKDQVDNLEKKEIIDAVTINGLLDPIERSKAIERVEQGLASMLYISPESLRSVTIERLLLKRKIARFVIDEAHCFSAWGQDFRVDYLYIGDFIKNLQQAKNLEDPIPVSCFTATAKLKVVEDIRAYFKEKLNLDLELFRSNTSRTNLRYKVYSNGNASEKYAQLRSIIEAKDQPAIVYVSRTKQAYKVCEQLQQDGFKALPFHGKMTKEEKTANQNAFMDGETNIMVATSAFGMGVDKSDVATVVHYEISDSLENYIQEAGRAGRDERLVADCHILYNEEDLNNHFALLNRSKLDSKEINQIWRAIKELTRTRNSLSNSALEIARKAGWDDGVNEIETRVTTAIAALEDAGYIKRGQNSPLVFANSILAKTAQGAINKINTSEKFSPERKTAAIRVVKKLFSSKSKRLSTDEAAESRVDYLSDRLGLAREEVIRVIELMRDEKILAHAKDLTAFLKRTQSLNRSLQVAESFRKQEEALFDLLQHEETIYHLKELMEKMVLAGITDGSPHHLRTILNFWSIKNWIKRQHIPDSRHHVKIGFVLEKGLLKEKLSRKAQLSRIITKYLHKRAAEIKTASDEQEEVLVEFSVQELKEQALSELGIFNSNITSEDIEDTLFYLSRIEAIKIEGGFMVHYNRLTINRLEKDNRKRYTVSDYEKLQQHYQQKVQQIHIVGEYAKKMIRNYQEALQFVEDYFSLNNYAFLSRYFPGSRQDEIKRTLTPEKFMKLFGVLSADQLSIIRDQSSQHIVVAAGPGSGKTKVLVHKLASLLLAEDVKHEQLLMLTFSRAAATHFKKELLALIGKAAHFIEIKTFHSYCFDLLGRMGSLAQSENILKTTVSKIKAGEIEPYRITKTVLVVDEAQDMNEDEYSLVNVLMEKNEEMRVIFVGDDDQNIYGFRGSDSAYMQQLITEKSATRYDLTLNYRSRSNIVSFANQWAATIQSRLKNIPGFPYHKENGVIHITEHQSESLITALSEKIQYAALSGSTCILTTTNDEAVLLHGLLLKKNLHAKLIQSNEGFNMTNIQELKFFTQMLENNTTGPSVAEEVWKNAVQETKNQFRHSDKLPMTLHIISTFETIYPEKKYKSDWNSFLTESKLEDFISINSELIYISTIHKAKGKQFDNVFILLRNFLPDQQEKNRLLYVGITRAVSFLSIHYNGNFLRNFKTDELIYKPDKNKYPWPNHITLHLTHKDVQLGYYSFVQHRLKHLLAGQPLKIMPDGLGNTQGDSVLKYSKKFRDELDNYLSKGFQPGGADVNFIVYWKNEEEKDILIVLPRLYLNKKSQ